MGHCVTFSGEKCRHRRPPRLRCLPGRPGSAGSGPLSFLRLCPLFGFDTCRDRRRLRPDILRLFSVWSHIEIQAKCVFDQRAAATCGPLFDKGIERCGIGGDDAS